MNVVFGVKIGRRRAGVHPKTEKLFALLIMKNVSRRFQGKMFSRRPVFIFAKQNLARCILEGPGLGGSGVNSAGRVLLLS